EDYEQRRRQLDEQHQATLALVEAAWQAQVRALDLVWLASGAGGIPLVPQLEGFALSPARLLGADPAAPGLAPKPAASPEPSKRSRVWSVIEEIEQVFEALPEVFDHRDLNRALGRELDRGVARRNLQLLIEEEALAPVDSEGGRLRLRYRKLCAKIVKVEE